MKFIYFDSSYFLSFFDSKAVVFARKPSMSRILEALEILVRKFRCVVEIVYLYTLRTDEIILCNFDLT